MFDLLIPGFSKVWTQWFCQKWDEKEDQWGSRLIYILDSPQSSPKLCCAQIPVIQYLKNSKQPFIANPSGVFRSDDSSPWQPHHRDSSDSSGCLWRNYSRIWLDNWTLLFGCWICKNHGFLQSLYGFLKMSYLADDRRSFSSRPTRVVKPLKRNVRMGEFESDCTAQVTEHHRTFEMMVGIYQSPRKHHRT